ncbi:hypothetical protein BD626DRAFT_507212 [Schizophyllum amplum]|uniref:Uncharacterized protein n=1 Tax=Schizophyllum amplum TaxID=97359 RepID=A0A550C4Z4_9AGAR|nr:hypothetical protein BD626DRAFT_507212 [Auriculariopsis ampla]
MRRFKRTTFGSLTSTSPLNSTLNLKSFGNHWTQGRGRYLHLAPLPTPSGHAVDPAARRRHGNSPPTPVPTSY